VQPSNAKVMMQMILELPHDKKLLTIIHLWDWWTTRNKVNAGEKENLLMKYVMLFKNTM
jgi:hypothetical protein